MNTARRRVVAEFAAAVLVCAALHLLVPAPVEKRARAVRAEADSLATPRRAAVVLSADQTRDLMARAAEARARAALLAAPARSETELFSRVMSLASDCSVRVDQLQPLPASVLKKAGDGAAPPGPDAPAPPADTRVACAMTAVGSYDAVSRFIGRLVHEAGFTCLRSVRIDPADEGGGELVRARLTTEHLGPDLSRLAALVDGDAPAIGQEAAR